MTYRCPACGGLQVGKVGSDQYYCWNCFMEFSFSRGMFNLYEVAEDGTLIAMERNADLL